MTVLMSLVAQGACFPTFYVTGMTAHGIWLLTLPLASCMV